jgi:hypothetical protein
MLRASSVRKDIHHEMGPDFTPADSFCFRQRTGVSPGGTRVQDERAIIQLRDALLKAYDAGDGKTLSEIEDDDFTLAAEFGQMTKQQHLDQVRGRDAADRGGSRDRRRRQG